MKILYMLLTVSMFIWSDNIPLRQHGKRSDAIPLKEKVGQMLMVGFVGTSARAGSKICQDIRKYNLGGVILFDVNPLNRKKPKNIVNKQQVAALTKELQACSKNHDLFIAVDQEGGKVQRLKKKYNFYGNFPKASTVGKMTEKKARIIYKKMAQELKSVGINFNLAPVADLAINPKNFIIYKLGRSFGKEPKKVYRYISIFLTQMYQNGIVTSLKHFPGHGSSLGDTHKGFVDITKNWNQVELEPYKLLIGQNKVDTIMAAHVFNARLDPDYPASLSEPTLKNLLRKEMGYSGVIITDDLQMGAIRKKYTFDETILFAIEASNDILLFGNQINPKNMATSRKLVDTIMQMVNEGLIEKNSIDSAYARIKRLKHKYLRH